MERKIHAVFVAGGSGSRMGSAVPKQFLELDGVPVLQRTVNRFREAVPDIDVIIVLPETSIVMWKELCIRHSFDCPHLVVKGGITRFHSVKNALDRIPEGDIVMIHDGVRPFVSAALVREMASRMSAVRALIPAIPMTDTLKCLKDAADGLLQPDGPDPDRSRIWGAQTPQVFRSEDIRKAYCQAYDTSFTDDASVAAKYGIPLSFIRGERFNIKITTPEDLVFAEAILKRP